MTGKAQFFPRISLVVSLGLLSLVMGTPSQAKIDGSSTSEFERLIFTSPTKVKYSSQKFGLKLLIEFSKPIEGNITSATKKLGKFIKQAKMQDSGREVVVEFTGNHKFKDPNILINKQGFEFDKIVIEDDVWIAARCTILSGVTIGRGSVIAAGSVITKDIPPFSVVAGVPGKIISKRE